MVKTQDYGMFTDAGNQAIQGIVMVARVHQLSQNTVRAMLSALSQEEAFEEATDTAVRETVFKACFG